jgi:hypothetical protein
VGGSKRNQTQKQKKLEKINKKDFTLLEFYKLFR